MSGEPTPVLRIVKPRKTGYKHMPIIAVADDGIIVERTGEMFQLEQLAMVIVAEPSSILACTWAGDRILQLHEAYEDSPHFQYRMTPTYRELDNVNEKQNRRAVMRGTIVTLVGFPGHYHHPIDPQSFIRTTINLLDKRNLPESVRVLDWVRQVRRFCKDNDIPIKASAGGLAAQLLKDPRFYPHARRKAPRVINNKARQHLPGNYYKLLRPAKHATYLDMTNSHHNLAREIQFPDANTLKAYGYFGPNDRAKEWAKPGTARYDRVIGKPGLFHIRLSTPPGLDELTPPQMGKPGHNKAWVYSNELPLIRELGGRVEAIYSCIIAQGYDEGLNRYAEWAIQELEKRADQRQWLKPTLHNVYGLLAARPKHLEIGWRISTSEREEMYPLANRMVPVKVIRSRGKVETAIVNVVHRGMIEAEQRKRVIELARELKHKGGKILCMYADSLFVQMDQLPLLPHPWRSKVDLSNLHFRNATSFESDQLTRLPGVARSRRPAASSIRPAG